MVHFNLCRFVTASMRVRSGQVVERAAAVGVTARSRLAVLAHGRQPAPLNVHLSIFRNNF